METSGSRATRAKRALHAWDSTAITENSFAANIGFGIAQIYALAEPWGTPGNHGITVLASSDRIAVSQAFAGWMIGATAWPAWLLVPIVLLSVAALYACRRSKDRVALELQRLRSRIAADLHDDVGTSLSQVAIMSEVASQKITTQSAALREIASVSRDVLKSLSEIVWTLDPGHDRLHDLAERMRWFAGETLSARGVLLEFHASEPASDRHLTSDARRQLFLIFKEGMNNIARHAGAAHAVIILREERDRLHLHVEDDGRGFDPGQKTPGHGLCNMKRRASLLGGQLETRSQPGRGTSLDLWIPIPRGRWRWAPVWRTPHEQIPHEHAGPTRARRRRIAARA